MKFKDIIVWLVLFVVGSLIVSFLISPNSFNNFKSNMENVGQTVIEDTSTQKAVVQETPIQKPQPIPAPTPKVQEPPKPQENIINIVEQGASMLHLTCSIIDGAGGNPDVNVAGLKKSQCAMTCNNNGKLYVGYFCNDQDLLTCKCK